MSSLTMRSGAQMPALGLGTWQSKEGEVEEAVKVAVKAGYRHIDCAYAYGNEKEVGRAINSLIDSGIVKRQDLFVVSKLWNTRHSPNDVKPSIMESLQNLDLDYVDLYHMHYPHAFKPGPDMFPRAEDGVTILYADIHYMDTWRAMEACADEGLVKDLGVSNFNSIQIQDVMDNARIKPSNLQVEVNPYFAQNKLVSFAQERGITVTAYSPLGSPKRPWAKPEDPLLLEEPTLKALADKYKKSPAQIVLRWLIQRSIAAIPKSVTPLRIRENLDLSDFELTPEDMGEMATFDRNERLVIPMVIRDGKEVSRDGLAPYYPFQPHIEF